MEIAGIGCRTFLLDFCWNTLTIQYRKIFHSNMIVLFSEIFLWMFFVSINFYFINASVTFIFLYVYVQENSLSVNFSFQLYVKEYVSIILPMLYEVTTDDIRRLFSNCNFSDVWIHWHTNPSSHSKDIRIREDSWWKV